MQLKQYESAESADIGNWITRATATALESASVDEKLHKDFIEEMEDLFSMCQSL